MRLALLVALAAFAAGCAAPLDPAGTGAAPPAALGGDLLAHDATGLRALPEAARDLALRVSPTGYPRGEPTLGVTSDGTIFAVGAVPTVPGNGNVLANAVLRSKDHGATWDAIRWPTFGVVDVDPWVWVDPATDRVYNGPLYAACTWLSWSDDLGDTWTTNPAAGCGVPGHDHQKVTTGPPAAGVPTSGYDSVVYYAYNSFRGEGTVAIASYDGGLTWTNQQTAHPSDPCNGGINGPVAVAADGTAYLPKPTCDGPAIAVSRDSGASWDPPVVVGGVALPENRLVTLDAAVDAAGNAYVVYQGDDGLLRLSHSTDRGLTWSQPARVSPPGVLSTVFAVVSAGDAGRVAVAYLGTDSDPATWTSTDPSEAPDDAVWHLYVGFLEDALAGDPIVVTKRVTTGEDPAQRGCVWLRGGTEPCRNLRDFIDMVELDGRVYVVYADGCKACASASEREALGETTVVIVERGISLRSGELLPLDGSPEPTRRGSILQGALQKLS